MEKTKKCQECGMPLDKCQCSCNPELCCHCCKCDKDCECGCVDKVKIDK